VWQTGAAGNVAFDLGQTPLLVGRGDECDIRVDEPLVSRTHARIDWRSGVHVVVDLQSTNFTRVNGRRVLVEQALEPGDLVQFARAVCVYEV
jgi:pSer/pThr/pTyr-binding forkhead associated (FHA) protein